jgi:uncharacterized protein (TIGR02186 family)
MNDPNAGRATPPVLTVALLLCSASFVAAAPAFPRAGEDPAALVVSPERVPVTSRYHGSTLNVDIVVPSGGEIALEVEGERKRMVFNRKGRVVVFWMNVGEVIIDNAPQAYMLYTSTALSKLAPRGTLRELGLGLDALGPQIETRGEGIDRETMLLEFYEYEKRRGLLDLSYGSLRPDRGDPESGDDDRELYSARIHLPSRIPVGAYQVRLHVFRDGGLIERASKTVTIEKTGLPLFVSRLARKHPGEYGLLAIVVAVMAGLSVGFVFRHVGRRRR